MTRHWRMIPALVPAACLLLASPAFAHHLMGGAVPNTIWQGLLSGLGHPIVGLDHLAFIVAAGLLAQLAGRLALMPLLFIAGTAAGCFIHVGRYTLPWAEPAVALTIAAAAALVLTRTKAPTGVLAALLAAAGLLHGYAYGESIVGAEQAPLAAYIAGFAVIQYAIAVASGLALRALVQRRYLSEAKALGMAGSGLALLAVLYLGNAVLAG